MTLNPQCSLTEAETRLKMWSIPRQYLQRDLMLGDISSTEDFLEEFCFGFDQDGFVGWFAAELQSPKTWIFPSSCFRLGWIYRSILLTPVSCLCTATLLRSWMNTFFAIIHSEMLVFAPLPELLLEVNPQIYFHPPSELHWETKSHSKSQHLEVGGVGGRCDTQWVYMMRWTGL